MSRKFELFDAAAHPLRRGVNVVEASAGTGKTFAIAMLVVRFVAEFGVPVEELLVVSYTRAATEELRTRIRNRLVQGRDFLRGGEDETKDEVLSRMLQQLPDKRLALERLELALLDMDRAAVFTIHGFCQRMLQEQALESGQLFDMELTADIGQVKEELVDDYWRCRLYELQPFHCSLFLSHFATPEALYQSVRDVGPEDSIAPADRISPEQALAEVDAALAVLVRWWQGAASSLEHCFQEALGQGMFKKDFAQEFASWWRQCAAFFAGETMHLPPGLANLGLAGLLGELHGNKLRGEAKKLAFLQGWPLAQESVERFLASCGRAVLALRIGLAQELQSGLRERLHKQGRFSFDDLVILLAQALEREEGQELRSLLAARFQVALIDEFQDTDSAQYRIFSRLFGAGKHFLYLIGDPKQAIYKFRGADIYAYFQARQSADHTLGLGRNYRSSPLLVQAVNTLFMQKEDSFVAKQLPYHAVSAAKSAESWRLWEGEKAQAAMVYCSLQPPEENGGKAWSSGRCQQRIQAYVVAEIRELLRGGSLVVPVNDSLSRRRVTAGDIAVLVRTNSQAEAFQEILALANIPAVMSSRKTVFATKECRELMLVSRAVAAPSDIGLLRTAMSCNWFGMGGPELYAQVQDEKSMEAWMGRFHDYHSLWQEKGFLTMMNSLFVRESVLQTLAGCSLAERRISNLMHLVELVQEAESRDNFAISHTLQYLASMMEGEERSEHAELRLESDELAVKVVTMHAVKGLEYPIVFCPYLWYRSARLQKEANCLSYHDDQGQVVTDLGSLQFLEKREEALKEELAEEVRLLYVALTRAACRCYVFWADVAKARFTASSRESALSWVLSLAACADIGGQTERIAEICAKEAAELRLLPDHASQEVWMETETSAAASFGCRTFSRSSLPGEWLLTSYSALAGQGHSGAAGSGAQVLMPETEESPPIVELPLGAGLGNVVHGLLEELPFSRLAAGGGYEEEVVAQCRRYGVTADTEQLMRLLQAVTSAPLAHAAGQGSFSLAELEEKDVLKEMPFYFHLRAGSTARINELLAFSEVVQPIQERSLQGYLTGFVDLICRVDAKYYIMDYKTNYLGDRFLDYSGDNLVAAMRDHNYGLQYWIYTLVLHRFLGNTLATYEYERDFGGVFYLFARGMDPGQPGNGLYYDRPQFTVLDALHTSLGAG
ncbi:MAG: exodeoxyribonuclease V subunit beta [Proteobacteria bacterium]|nr:exodeoxyribonuclease V subunit beta [Pseudomonadota bacterium]MBU1057463.1 exodeoxyribonuclease V subunit beta [Pseudomonadota bacterium]